MAVIIDSTRCTGCEVCSSVCEPMALTRAVDGEVLHIAIDHSRCNSCGDCERLCPEHALKVTEERGPTDGLITLFQCQMAKCRECGRCFAPEPLVAKFRHILKDRDPRIVATIDLCPQCKDRTIDDGYRPL
ncbi:MAG: 4Fe-4S binding protein [Chloroflexota bacterium]|nr:4Fe-4S binding protein [Chloroflexota bacterium]